jgi:insulin receptor
MIIQCAIKVFELFQEIALYSLTNITRGAVRIEKNPMLCFVETIDWTLIARHSSKDDHYIVVSTVYMKLYELNLLQ